MSAAELFVGVLFLATLSEFLVERIFGDWVRGKAMTLIALAAGMALCLGLQVNGLELVSLESNEWVGYIITGLIVGSGSSAVHLFLGKYLEGKCDVEE